MSHWTALPLSPQLGWPLRYQKTGEHNKSTLRKNLPANEVLELLTLDVDPTSPTFGKSTDTCNCEIILANADASELHPVTINILQSYIKMALKDVIEFGKGEGTKEKAEAAVAKAVSSDLEPFLGAYCKNLVCKKCGVPGGWREHKLSACGKCQKVQYCGRECQAADWKAHKKDCKRN